MHMAITHWHTTFATNKVLQTETLASVSNCNIFGGQEYMPLPIEIRVLSGYSLATFPSETTFLKWGMSNQKTNKVATSHSSYTKIK